MNKLKIGMIGGGIGGQVGKWHRYAINLDGKYDLVAGCFLLILRMELSPQRK